MGQIIVFQYPIRVTLEHNDVVVDTYEDEWGTYDIYRISKVYWEEQAGLDWTVTVTHPSTGQPVQQSVEAYESGSRNLPTPAQFDSFPLEINCTLVRG